MPKPRRMPVAPMRLHRMIALASELSRRAAEKAIAAGQVVVNGQVVTAMGIVVDPHTDRVCLRGKPLSISERRTYLAYHKPRGLLVTASDPSGRPTIWDDLELWKGKCDAVGRLDRDSEGLLLLTDDGDFLFRLTHPRHRVWKSYRVRTKGQLNAHAVRKLQEGIDLADGKALPARVRCISADDRGTLLEISIREGKNRQVRRMCEAVENPVIRLRRTAIGCVKLGPLKPGRWRHLKPQEVAGLLQEADGGK